MLLMFRRPEEKVNLLEGYVRGMEARLHAVGKVSEDEDREWMESLIKEQDEEGFWGLLKSPKVDGDVRVAYWYEPTYIATACLVKYWAKHEAQARALEGFEEALKKGLKASVGRQFAGHGYDDMKGRMKALEVFAYGSVLAFIEDYPEMCMEFTQLIERMEVQLSIDLDRGNTKGMWGEDYRAIMQNVWNLLREYYPYKKVFVYGTLMKGRCNHQYYLSQAKYLGERVIQDYSMYDLGNYPGIVPCEGEDIRGELYRVDQKALDELDELEGEGVLYNRVQVETYDEAGAFEEVAYTYVYNGNVEASRKVSYANQPWGSTKEKAGKLEEEYVWYVSYGSNMLYERFLYYINGGRCHLNQKDYLGCSNKQLPLADEAIILPYKMYFGNQSGTWQGKGVAFFDLDTPGMTLGRMYLITKQQFEEIWIQEGKGENWYNKALSLGTREGVEMITFTNQNRRTANEPCQMYLEVIQKGIQEVYPTLTKESMSVYLGMGSSEQVQMLEVLRVIRENPTRLKVVDIIQRTGLGEMRVYTLVDELLDRGYIRQDRRDRVGRHDLDATFFTEGSKREEIDGLLRGM